MPLKEVIDKIEHHRKGRGCLCGWCNQRWKINPYQCYYPRNHGWSGMLITTSRFPGTTLTKSRSPWRRILYLRYAGIIHRHPIWLTTWRLKPSSMSAPKGKSSQKPISPILNKPCFRWSRTLWFHCGWKARIHSLLWQWIENSTVTKPEGASAFTTSTLELF